MELFFNFQAMERNGDVVAEIKNCNTANCALISKSFNTGKYKMCKDDIASPLFCSASDCLGKSIMMDSKDKSTGTYLSSEEKLFYNARRNDECNMPAIESSANSSADSFMSASSSPTWEKPPKLQSFSPKGTGKLSIKDSFLNGSKLQLTGSNPSVDESNSLSRTKKAECNLNNSEIINDKLLLDYEAETSSSSIEELYYSPGRDCQQPDICRSPVKKCGQLEVHSSPVKRCEAPEEYYTPSKKCKLSEEYYTPENKIGHLESKTEQKIFEIDSNHNVKVKSDINESENKNYSSLPSPIFAKFCENIYDSNSHLKNERLMPELSPPLICLDDDDSLPENKKEQCEVIDVADSPKMPTLIPFTSEVDEAIRIKTETVSDSEKDKHFDSDSNDEIRQPQVLLQRLPLNQSQKEKDNISPVSVKMDRKSLNEGPEIEEIEGVRFFQFRSKQEMEEFNRKPEKTEADEDMIIPTKTTDITQIKGWRTKYFAPESQFQNQLYKFDFLKHDDFCPDDKNSADNTDEGQNKNSNKKECDSQDSESKKVASAQNCDAGGSEIKQQNDSVLKTDGSEEKILIKDIKEEKEEIKNPMSAFISEELDQYLLNSSALNVSLLEKINPNIVPIPPDASILSLGKLRKVDKPFPTVHIYKRKREIYHEENITSKSIITIGDSPDSPSVITLGSSEESCSEEDIPVAKLKSKKRFSPRKRNLSNKGFKRKSLDSEFDQAGKRLVLRLTKEGNGVSKGYKVSDISCKKDKADPESVPSSPSTISSVDDEIHEPVTMPDDGSLPVIKQTLFSKKNEPHLLEEFLNNLNMYGTRKDVTMLVQANQSYFDEGPTLSAKNCAKAVSVLFSNKTFLDVKQKAKKKKLKTWQKYLPKKLSDKQKMKIKLSKRKTRIQSLLDDAGDMVQVVRGKRSIRLPARYLDSAVLAASEWVSPIITLDDDNTSKRNKRQSVEAVDKNKMIEENKSKDSEPSCTTLSSSESSSSTSSSEEEEEEASMTSEISVKSADLPLKRNTVAKEIIEKKKINTPEIKHSPKDGKKSTVTVNQKSVPGVSTSDKKGLTSFTRKYMLPNCGCKPTSRTAVFEYKSKEFFCFFCYSIQKRLFDNAASAINFAESEISGVKKEISVDDSSSKDDLNKNVFIKSKDLVSKSSEIRNDVEHHDLIKCDTNSTKFQSSSVSDGNQNRCQLSDSSSPLANVVSSDHCLKKDKTVVENVNVSSSVPSNNASSKLYLLVTSVKSVSNVNNNVPTSAHPVIPKQNEYPPKLNKKNKPPILIRKTPTGLVTPNINESSYLSHVDGNSPCFKNSVPLRLPFSSQDTSISTQSAALRLAKMAENASSAYPQLTISPVVNSSDGKDNLHQNIGLINSSVSVTNSTLNSLSSKVVTAYKVGDSYWLCNTLTNPAPITNKVVTPAFVQKQHTNGPIISSVQSVQSSALKNENSDLEVLPNGLTKCAVVNYQNKSVNETQEKLPNVCQSQNNPNVALNDHYYHKKKPQNRRKSPLAPTIYADCENENFQLVENKSESKSELDGDEEIDVETVDSNFSFGETRKKDAESDSDISDNECADIFSSSTDHLATVYSKKSIKERKRRLLIKSGFENLKASSKYFKNAKSCLEILEMALCVIDSHKKRERLYTLAKERLKIHNTMLLEKMMRMIEGIDSSNNRDKIKMQIIKDLALNQEKYKDKKAVFPSKDYKEVAFNKTDSERNKSSSDAPDIGMRNCNLPEQSTAESSSSNTGSNSETLKRTNLSPDKSGSIKFKEMKLKVNASLKKKASKAENISDFTEDLDSGKICSGNSDEDIQICESMEPKKSPTKSPQSKQVKNSEKFGMSVKENKISKTPEKEYPGLIPLFHPKVYQQKFGDSQSSGHSLNSEESSHRTEVRGLRPALSNPGIADAQNVSISQEVEDDDVSIIGSKIVSPVNANALMSDSCDAVKTDIELTKAAHAANKLFGPCTVQKVQLKNGKTVFAYKPETSGSGSYSSASADTPVRPALPLNTNGVRNLDEVFSAISASKNNSNQNKSSVPEEIVISDSEDETDNNNENNVSKTQSERPLNRVENLGAQMQMLVEKSDSHSELMHNEDSDSGNEELHIDESCSQNTDNSSL